MYPVICFFTIIFTTAIHTGILVPSWFDPGVSTNKVNVIEFEGITVMAENLEVNQQHMIFDVEIINHAGYPVSLDYSNIYSYVSNNPYPADTDTECNRAFEAGLIKQFPLSEERVAGDLSGKIEKSRKTGTILGLITAGLVIFDAAMDAHDLNRYEWTPRNQRNANIRKALTFTGIAATDILHSKARMEKWKGIEDRQFLHREILDDILIEPGGSVRGKMFFPVTDKAFIRLIFLIRGTELVLDYRWAEPDDLRKLGE